VLALAAIIAMARCDLNAADFISRGVEGDGERHNKSIGCGHLGMETPAPEEISLDRQSNWFAWQQYMLTLHQGRLK